MSDDEKISVPYPSKKWAETYMELLNNSEEYEQSAKDWEGAMLFVITPDGGATPLAIGTWLDLWHGKCRGYDFWVEGQEKPKSDFIYTGPEKNWLGLIAGKIDPIQGLMAGKFKLQGNMPMVMRHTLAAKILVQNLQKFDLDIITADNSDPNADSLTFHDKNDNIVLTVNRQDNTFEMLV